MKTLAERIQTVRSSLAREQGFSMLPAITAVFVGSLISIGAWTAAHADVSLQNTDRYEKIAYSQAESGVTDYVQHMAEDPGYWQYCDQPPGPNGTTLGIGTTAVNDTDKSGVSGTNARRWLPQPTIGSSQDAALTAQYTIDLVPVNGQPSCKAKANRNESMVDKTTGTIRLRITGRAGPPVPSGQNIANWRQNKWKRRSIVIEFRRKGFLDYAYFTDKEGRDPTLLSDIPETSCTENAAGTPPVHCSPKTACTGYYSPPDAAANSLPLGRYYYDSSGSRPTCTEITFINSDVIQGPFHTNDAIKIESNGGPSFGTDPSDVLEVFDSRCPFRTTDHPIPTGITDTGHAAGNCPAATGTGSIRPDHSGPVRLGALAGYLPLPESNEDLKLYADTTSSDPDYQGYMFYGKTKITVKQGSIDVTNPNYNGGVLTNLPYPSSGVIYVDNESGVSSCEYDPGNGNYSTYLPDGCAQVEISGTYDDSLTISSASDIVVTGNLQRATGADTAVMGLIADNFVRVRHYKDSGVSGSQTCSRSAPLSSTTIPDSGTRVNEIHAAILTLHHSFTVDDYDCGNNLGNLHVFGVLAQAYRGTVGQGTHGYTKNYEYDRRYKYLTPPHFLVPTLSTWRISRYREQVPACACT